MNVLVACEFSGVVREAFRKRGHDAFSCDILPAADNSLYHIQRDVRYVLDDYEKWDLLIAHPPCTYLSTCGNRHLKQPGREEARDEAFRFFMEFTCVPIPHICIENPHGYVNTHWRKPDQTIHPWYFGDPRMKRTGLWLKNLPPLTYDITQYTKPEPIYWTPDGRPKYWTHKTKNHARGTSGKERSVTSWAIAEAMAEQWGNYDREYYQSRDFSCHSHMGRIGQPLQYSLFPNGYEGDNGVPVRGQKSANHLDKSPAR